MSHLNPNKLHVKFMQGLSQDGPIVPRAYTLTHSDSTGDLFLTIGPVHNYPQVSGWYTRLMRDEVLAEWELKDNAPCLHVHCHVSGGLVFGTAGWREAIFRYHLPQVMEAFRYGDKDLFQVHPELDQAAIFVHFHARQSRYNRIEKWGRFEEFRLTHTYSADNLF